MDTEEDEAEPAEADEIVLPRDEGRAKAPCGSRTGVETLDDMPEGCRARFALRKWKKAVVVREMVVSTHEAKERRKGNVCSGYI